MQGRLESQLKIEKRIESILSELPKEINEYYLNIAPSKEFRTCLEYVKKIKCFLVWYSNQFKVSLKKIDFSQITDTEIAQYLKTIEVKTKQNGDIEFTSFSYRKQIYSIINGFFDFLYKKRYISNNPVSLLEPTKRKDKVEHIFLKERDIDKILRAVNNGAGNTQAIHRQEKWKARDLAIVYTFILTGMRESALCEIDINKIDFENKILEVIDKEHKHNTYVISKKLESVINEWLEVRNELMKDYECDALFVSNQRKRIEPATVRAIINKYSEEGLGFKVSPHKLRAAFANIVYKETGDIEFTRASMKHENIATTKTYIESDEKKINQRVANILSSKF